MKKKLLGIALSLASVGVVGMASEAKAAPSTSSTTIEVNANPQWQWQRDRDGRSIYNRRRTRTVRQSRVVRFWLTSLQGDVPWLLTSRTVEPDIPLTHESCANHLIT